MDCRVRRAKAVRRLRCISHDAHLTPRNGTLIEPDGTRAVLPARAAGILFMTVDTDGMPPDTAVAIYTRGRFLVASCNFGKSRDGV
jgi:hypothetical protein